MDWDQTWYKSKLNFKGLSLIINNNYSEPASSNNSNVYICRVCKNTEKLRLSLLDSSVETLLGKLNRANECFTDSMDKVESLSLHRHFLVFNSEKAQTQQSLLSSIEKCINDLTHKTEVIEESLNSLYL